MSDTQKYPSSKTEAGTLQIIKSDIKDLGGFSVRRVLPAPSRRMVGPFIFFDHFGPTELPPGEGVQVRPHPHIGLSTVSYLFEGEIKRIGGDHAGSARAFRAALEKIEGSVLGGNDLRLIVPMLYAELAKSLVWSGALDAAEEVLDKGFRLDPSDPMLWVSKARYQFASGLPQLAQASVNYALAIWKDADPEYKDYIRARELEAEIQKTL